MLILLVQVDQRPPKRVQKYNIDNKQSQEFSPTWEGQKSDQEFSPTVHLRSALVVEPPPRLASCSVYCAQQWDETKGDHRQ